MERLDLGENGYSIDVETDVAPYVASAGCNAKDDDDVLNNEAEKLRWLLGTTGVVA